MNYEAIPIEAEYGSTACVITGLIVEITYGDDSNAAKIRIVVEGGEEIIENVPIHYHCQGSEAVDDGRLAFREDNNVYLLYDGSGLPYSSSTLKIVGFVDGVLRECVKRVYLRPKIDGNPLLTGGQTFEVWYHKHGSPDSWSRARSDSPHSRIYVTVRGRWDGTEQDKYGHGEYPLYLWDWDSGEIRIVLHAARQKGFVDFPGDPPYYDEEGRPFTDINEAMAPMSEVGLYTFAAHYEDPEGYYIVPIMHNYAGACNITTNEDTTVDRTRHVEINIGSVDPGEPGINEWAFTGCWATPTTQCSQCHTYAKVPEGARRYRGCSSIWATFTAEEAAVLMENREASIYNWDTEEYETNQIVLSPDIPFNLVETLLDQPQRSLALNDWHFCGPYVACEGESSDIGRTMNPKGYAPIIFDWVHEGEGGPVAGSQVEGTYGPFNPWGSPGGGLGRGAKITFPLDPPFQYWRKYTKGVEELNGTQFTGGWESIFGLYAGKHLVNSVSPSEELMVLAPHDSMDLTLTRGGCPERTYKMEPLPAAHSLYRY